MEGCAIITSYFVRDTGLQLLYLQKTKNKGDTMVSAIELKQILEFVDEDILLAHS